MGTFFRKTVRDIRGGPGPTGQYDQAGKDGYNNMRQDFHGTCCSPSKQWSKEYVYYITKTVSGFPEKESLVFNFCPRKGLLSAIFVRQISSQMVAPINRRKYSGG